MKDFICKKCGNTTYIMQEKLNGTGKAIGLYCAKCGTWHKWLNKQEKVVYATVDTDKDKEIARLTAENQRLKEEVAEQKSIAADEHATQMEWFRLACDYKSENAELRATLSKMETVEKELRDRLDNAVELPCKVGDTVYWVEDDPNIDGICEFTIQGFSFSTNNNDGLRVIIGTFLEPCVDYYKNKQLFFDRSEAEARLAELKGGRE